MNADRIIVLDGGTIAQQGTHDELITTDGPYKRLYEIQFREAPQKKVIKMGKRIQSA